MAQCSPLQGGWDLCRHLRRGAEEDAAVALFEYDFVAFEEAEALAEVGGEFDGSGLG